MKVFDPPIKIPYEFSAFKPRNEDDDLVDWAIAEEVKGHDQVHDDMCLGALWDAKNTITDRLDPYCDLLPRDWNGLEYDIDPSSESVGDWEENPQSVQEHIINVDGTWYLKWIDVRPVKSKMFTCTEMPPKTQEFLLRRFMQF